MHLGRWTLLLGALGTVALASGSRASTFTRSEANRLYAAGGFPISLNGDHPTNRCGAAASPHITFVDMNGDGRKEALFTDAGPCYKPDGRWFAIAAQQSDGGWRRILEGEGVVTATGTAYAGWFVLAATAAGRTERLHFDGSAYRPASGQLSAAAPASPVSAAGRRGVGADAAIFAAAGLKQRRGHWESGCNDGNDDRNDSYQPAAIAGRKDLNGDGRPDAVITESGTFCYGATGTAFWIVGQQADGSWKLMANEIGVADFKGTRGANGWPDIVVGGPGFCFPVIRWNGAAYKVVRHEDDGKPCRPS